MKRDDEVLEEFISMKRIVERSFRKTDALINTRMRETENDFTGLATKNVQNSMDKLAKIKTEFMKQITVVEQDWVFRNNLTKIEDV